MVETNPYDNRLPPLQATLARTERVTNRARDDRVHRFALPTLPNQAIPAGVRDEISPCAAVRVHQLTAPANGGNAIIRTNRVTITARIGYHTPRRPFAPVPSIAAGISPQAGHIRPIAARPPARTPGQDDLRPRADRVYPLRTYPKHHFCGTFRRARCHLTRRFG